MGAIGGIGLAAYHVSWVYTVGGGILIGVIAFSVITHLFRCEDELDV
jgi:hypothetical protein